MFAMWRRTSARLPTTSTALWRRSHQLQRSLCPSRCMRLPHTALLREQLLQTERSVMQQRHLHRLWAAQPGTVPRCGIAPFIPGSSKAADTYFDRVHFYWNIAVMHACCKKQLLRTWPIPNSSVSPHCHMTVADRVPRCRPDRLFGRSHQRRRQVPVCMWKGEPDLLQYRARVHWNRPDLQQWQVRQVWNSGQHRLQQCAISPNNFRSNECHVFCSEGHIEINMSTRCRISPAAYCSLEILREHNFIGILTWHKSAKCKHAYISCTNSLVACMTIGTAL
jgi:hypothetical protein